MTRHKKQSNPPAQSKGTSDAVDQSKGVFPFGVPHPPDAEQRAPGEMGGPYEESGRGSPELSLGHSAVGSSTDPALVEAALKAAEQPDVEQRREEDETPKGSLPPHTDQAAGKKGTGTP